MMSFFTPLPLPRRLRPLVYAALALLITLPAMWPFLAHGGYWQSHDGLFHLYRLLSLKEAWQQGHFYPRTFPDFAFGYGFAVLHFYGPLSYYVALALDALLPTLAAMRLAFALCYPLAALAAWALARDVWRGPREEPNEWAGLAAAAAYTYVPYHLINVQLRGALAESWAMVWVPLLFWAVWRVRPWALALALAALIVTHNLSVVLVALPLALWGAMVVSSGPPVSPHQRAGNFEIRNSKFEMFKSLLLAGVAALLLSAFYWLPVLLESRAVAISQDVGGLGFAEHLAPWQAWVARGASYRYFPEQGTQADFPLSWAQGALLALAALPLPWLWRDQRREALFWWGLLLATLFLLLPASFGLWKAAVFPFGLIQYPWRWLGLTALATAMVASAPLALLHGTSRRAPIVYSLGLALLLAWLAVSSLRHLPWQSVAVDPARHPAEMWQGDAAAGQVGATWTAEFLPLSVTEQRWALARAPEQLPDVGASSPLRVRRAGSDGFTLWAEVESAAPAPLTFPRFLLPSMQATVDGVAQPLQARSEMGLATVGVPAGSHRVELRAYPLAAQPWLAWLLWLPPLAFLLYGLSRLPRPWRLVAIIGIPLLLLSTRLAPGEGRALTLQNSLDAPVQIGEQAQLLGTRSDLRAVAPGEPLPVRLLWFNLLRTDQHYSTFVQLTTADGTLVAQSDSEPNLGTVPVPRWLPGQLIEDLHLLPLPADLPPGEYQLWGGIYASTPDGIQPLPGDSGERRLVGVLEIGD